MHALVLLTALLCASIPDDKGKGTDFTVMFWNLENFFDWKDSGYSDSDAEFSSYGERVWTKSRFYSKCNAIAKAIMWIGSTYGDMPDVIGFAEVENAFVVRSLVNSTALKKYDYGYVHYDSGDPRGIDVALIYRKDRFTCTGSSPHRIYDGSGRYLHTRDILEADFQPSREAEDRIVVLVNHHPSKYGGEKASFPRRMAAMTSLRNISDSLLNSGYEKVVAIGDFNDSPDNPAMEIIKGVLYDKSRDLFKAGKGTIRYHGKWELIDLILVSERLDSVSSMHICPVPFLMVEDSAAPGKKPLRTYSGPRYNGGVSDHLPVIGIFGKGNKSVQKRDKNC